MNREDFRCRILDKNISSRWECQTIRVMRKIDVKAVYKIEMKVKEVIKLIEQDGWFMVRMNGSHRQFKHIYKQGVVTIAGKLNNDLAKGTFQSILFQAGLKHERGKNV